MFSRRLMAVTTGSAVATMTNRKTTVALALPDCLPKKTGDRFVFRQRLDIYLVCNTVLMPSDALCV